MNQIVLNIISLFKNCKTDAFNRSSGSLPGSRDFLSSFKEYLNVAFHKSPQSHRPDATSEKAFFDEKPLNTASLNDEDIHLIKELLNLCDSSKKKVENILINLLEGNDKGANEPGAAKGEAVGQDVDAPGVLDGFMTAALNPLFTDAGGFSERMENVVSPINQKAPIGQFAFSPEMLEPGSDVLKWNRITLNQTFPETYAHGGIRQPAFFDPSDFSLMEFNLRNQGLTQQEMDQVFSILKDKNGSLNVEEFVQTLRGILNVVKTGAETKDDKILAYPVFNKANGIESYLPEKGSAEPGSMRDILAALVKMTEEGDAIRPESRTAVDRLLKRVDLAGIPHEPAASNKANGVESYLPEKGSAEPSSMRDILAALVKMTEEGEAMTPELRTAVDRLMEKREDKGISKFLKTDRAPNALKADNTPVENEKVLSQPNRYALTDTHGRQQTEDSLFHLKNAGLTSDTDTGIETKQAVKEEGSRAQSEIRAAHESPLMNRSSLSELIHTVKQTETPSKDALPAYLIDQVGKQINRSILNGDRIIRLRLKPPELGPLRIEMDVKANILKLTMTTENHSTRELLLSNIHELREALGEQGVRLERIDIQIDYDFNQSSANFREGLKEGQDQGQGFANKQLLAGDDQGDNESKPHNKNVSDHLLDLVA